MAIDMGQVNPFDSRDINVSRQAILCFGKMTLSFFTKGTAYSFYRRTLRCRPIVAYFQMAIPLDEA